MRMSKRAFIVFLVAVMLTLGVRFSYILWRDKSEEGQSPRALSKVGLAIHFYAKDHQDQLPADAKSLIPYLAVRPVNLRAERLGLSAGGRPAGEYIYVLPQGKLSDYPRAGEMVAAYEPLAYHDGAGINVLHVDGHVNWIFERDAAWLIKEVEAGRNPPRERPGP